MNQSAVEKIADAVLYEGYLLYPYRRSAVKNQHRFNFGVLYPREYCDLQCGSEVWEIQTECLLEGSFQATIEVKVRFLQMAETWLNAAVLADRREQREATASKTQQSSGNHASA